MSAEAEQMRREVTEMVASGSENEILGHYKALYGERILIVPDGRTGKILFSLPVVAFLVYSGMLFWAFEQDAKGQCGLSQRRGRETTLPQLGSDSRRNRKRNRRRLLRTNSSGAEGQRFRIAEEAIPASTQRIAHIPFLRSSRRKWMVWLAVPLVGILLIVGILRARRFGVRGNSTSSASEENRASAVLDIGILVFREGLECILVLAAVTASLRGSEQKYQRSVSVAAGIGFVATLLTWSVAVRIVDDIGEPLSALAVQAATGLLAILVSPGDATRSVVANDGDPVVGTRDSFVDGLWFSVFPTVEALSAQALAGVLVFGSYITAQPFARLKGQVSGESPDSRMRSSDWSAWDLEI
jgi:cytochrome c-type biogenesis protein CcmH/NrfF